MFIIFISNSLYFRTAKMYAIICSSTFTVPADFLTFFNTSQRKLLLPTISGIIEISNLLISFPSFFQRKESTFVHK